MPDVIERLLADHTDDGDGFCRRCRTPGRGTPGTRHPAPSRRSRPRPEVARWSYPGPRPGRQPCQPRSRSGGSFGDSPGGALSAAP